MHLVALFGRPFTMSQDSIAAGTKKRATFTAQIKSSSFHPVLAKKAVTQKKSLVTSTSNPKTSSVEPVQSTSEATLGNLGVDLKKDYFEDLKAHIEQHKHYPMMSRKLGQTGKVVVAFTLLGDGSFINIHLHQSCPFERLNLAALDAVKSVGRFRPIPKELGEKFMDIQVPIEYQSIN